MADGDGTEAHQRCRSMWDLTSVSQWGGGVVATTMRSCQLRPATATPRASLRPPAGYPRLASDSLAARHRSATRATAAQAPFCPSHWGRNDLPAHSSNRLTSPPSEETP